jgi:hypothetical protein
MENNMSIYTDMVEAGCEIDNHESDLYVKVSEESAAIVVDYLDDVDYSFFRSNIDGDMWYEFPFQYSPYWEEKSNG